MTSEAPVFYVYGTRHGSYLAALRAAVGYLKTFPSGYTVTVTITKTWRERGKLIASFIRVRLDPVTSQVQTTRNAKGVNGQEW